VHLNSDSAIRYSRSFRSVPLAEPVVRRVHLEGEAFFDVVRSEQSFEVTTFNARIEVLGTRFNVRSRPDAPERETRLALADGTVRMSALANTGSELTLTSPGEAARVRGSVSTTVEELEPMPGAMDHVLAWREQGFAAISRPIRDILSELERRFGVSIDVEAAVSTEDSLTLLYPRRAVIESILHDLCLVQECSYRRTSTGFTLMPPDE
jgi:ferric-dicitrate binding protein FerR (iron transport regulator)